MSWSSVGLVGGGVVVYLWLVVTMGRWLRWCRRDQSDPVFTRGDRLPR